MANRLPPRRCARYPRRALRFFDGLWGQAVRRLPRFPGVAETLSIGGIPQRTSETFELERNAYSQQLSEPRSVNRRAARPRPQTAGLKKSLGQCLGRSTYSLRTLEILSPAARAACIRMAARVFPRPARRAHNALLRGYPVKDSFCPFECERELKECLLSSKTSKPTNATSRPAARFAASSRSRQISLTSREVRTPSAGGEMEPQTKRSGRKICGSSGSGSNL
jgi:hypothetical protein